MRIDFYFGSAGGLFSITEKADRMVRIVRNGPSMYIEGNRPFWQSETHNSGVVSLLADRWIDMTSDKKDTASFTKDANKRMMLPSCYGLGGSWTYAGKAIVNGVKALKVQEDASNEAGSLDIESGTIPYILRVTAIRSQSGSGDLVFSNYGVQPDTAAPPGATPISQLSGNSGNSGNS